MSVTSSLGFIPRNFLYVANIHGIVLSFLENVEHWEHMVEVPFPLFLPWHIHTTGSIDPTKPTILAT